MAAASSSVSGSFLFFERYPQGEQSICIEEERHGRGVGEEGVAYFVIIGEEEEGFRIDAFSYTCVSFGEMEGRGQEGCTWEGWLVEL